MFELSERASPSRIYMIGIYDPIDQVHFEEVILPQSAPNNIKTAKQHYVLAHLEEAATIRIMACISIEEYLRAAHGRTLTTEEEKDKADIDLTLKLIGDWNEKQKPPAESYSVALASLLSHIALPEDFDDRVALVKEIAFDPLEIK